MITNLNMMGGDGSMNVVFQFLNRFREFCISELFEQYLYLYTGNDARINSRKKFYESFINNAIFDKEATVISTHVNTDMSDSPNPVYEVANWLFKELQWVREKIKTSRVSGTSLTENFEFMAHLSQVLIVLKINFCKYDSRFTFGEKASFFNNPKDAYITSPDQWEFLSNEIIWDKLINVDEYPMALTYICTHTVNDDFIDCFRQAITTGSFNRKLLFSEKAFNRLFEIFAESGYKNETPDAEAPHVISRCFCKVEVSDDCLVRTYYKLFFIKEFKAYYTLVGFSYEHYSFDANEYRDETNGDSCQVCFDKRAAGLFDERTEEIPLSLCSYMDVFE